MRAEILLDEDFARKCATPRAGSNDTLSTAEIRAAMAKKSEEFKQGGGEIYLHKPRGEIECRDTAGIGDLEPIAPPAACRAMLRWPDATGGRAQSRLTA